MKKIVLDQLRQLTNVRFKVNGEPSNEVPNEFNDIVYEKQSVGITNEVKVIFEDYIIKPFEGFDFHDKWNNGIPPYSKVMYGKITKETPKMYYFEVHTDTSTNMWCGWCPKKSCIVKN